MTATTSDIAITDTNKKPVGFTLGVVAAAAAFFGIFIGTAQGSGLLGLIVGRGMKIAAGN